MSRPAPAPPPSHLASFRRLSACAECGAQYDVSELPPSSRFHCACGAVVTVAETKAHEAAVVRCSSCGGPRQAQAESCVFCGSDFTLHERDLHTICPGCTARISDRARFCHACGLAISVLASAGEATKKNCPACTRERSLISRELGGEGLTVLECHACAGLWLGAEAFRLVERRARERQAATALVAQTRAPKASSGSGGRAYRPCPLCDRLMHRKNYGRRSGVLIDHCSSHGFWFDRGELETILRWIGDGGLSRAEEIEVMRRREETRARTPAAPISPLFESRNSSFETGRFLGGLLDFLALFS